MITVTEISLSFRTDENGKELEMSNMNTNFGNNYGNIGGKNNTVTYGSGIEESIKALSECEMVAAKTISSESELKELQQLISTIREELRKEQPQHQTIKKNLTKIREIAEKIGGGLLKAIEKLSPIIIKYMELHRL